MATIRITIKGTLGEISARSFVSTIDKSLGILRDLDRRISEQDAGTTNWLISYLGSGSACVDLRSRQRPGERDYQQTIAERFTGGLRMIREENKTPPYFSENNIIALKDVLHAFGRDGASGVNFSLDSGQITADFAAADASTLRGLLKPAYKAMGSIEGRVELVSVRRGRNYFSITQARSRRPIRCTLTKELEDNVIQALRERRRVVATGTIFYNERGQAVRIEVTRIPRYFEEEEKLPTIDQLLGSDADIASDVVDKEYLRSLSNG